MRFSNSLRMIAVIAFGYLASSAMAATYIVDQSGGGDYTTISGAIAGVSSGDTIQVKNGTYGGGFNINKGITLQNYPSHTPVIDSSNTKTTGVTISSNNVTFDGFTVSHYTSIGINFSSTSLTGVVVQNTTIHDVNCALAGPTGTANNLTVYSCPFGCSGASGFTLNNSTFHNNGESFYACSSATANTCTFTSEGYGANYCSNMVFNGCTWSSCTLGPSNITNLTVTGGTLSGGSQGFSGCTGVSTSRVVIHDLSGIAYNGCSGTFDHSTIVRVNHAFLYCSGTVTNTIISGTTGSYPDYFQNSPSTLTCSYSLFDMGSIVEVNTGQLADGGHNTGSGGNQVFENSSGNDFRPYLNTTTPALSSLAINTADPSSPVPPGSNGGSVADKGAIERDISSISESALTNPYQGLTVDTAAGVTADIPADTAGNRYVGVAQIAVTGVNGRQLTITASGTSARTFTLSFGSYPYPNSSSMGKLYFGSTGTSATGTVTTSGGTPNTATITVRGNVASLYANDIGILVTEGTDLVAQLPVTSLQLWYNASGPRVTVANDQLVPQQIWHQPRVANATIQPVTFPGSWTGFGQRVNQYTLAGISLQSTTGGTPTTDSTGMANVLELPSVAPGYVEGIYTSSTPGYSGSVGTGVSTDPEQSKGTTPCYGCSQMNGCTYMAEEKEACPQNAATPHNPETAESLFNGESSIKRTDMDVAGRALSWNQTRTYTSQDSDRFTIPGDVASTDFGYGWFATYISDRLILDNGNYVHIAGDGYPAVYPVLSSGSLGSPFDLFNRIRVLSSGNVEIRMPSGLTHTYNNPSASTYPGRLVKITDRNGNFMSFLYSQITYTGGSGSVSKYVLTTAVDDLGHNYAYRYYGDTTAGSTVASSVTAAKGRLADITDFNSRACSYEFDVDGNLIRATWPAVTGTPNGNDFPYGKTTLYAYRMDADIPSGVTGAYRERLRHNLLSVAYPNEVGSFQPGVDSVATRLASIPTAKLHRRYTYGEDPTNLTTFDRVTSTTVGGTNDNGVPCGGTYAYSYTFGNFDITALPSGLTSTLRVTAHAVTPLGNVEELDFNPLGDIIAKRDFTRGYRVGEPANFQESSSYNVNGLRTLLTLPRGNNGNVTFDSSNSERMAQGDILSSTLACGCSGASALNLETTYTYEPIFQQARTITDPRGNTAGYTPPTGTASAARYTTTNYFDYEEDTSTQAVGTGTYLTSVVALTAKYGLDNTVEANVIKVRDLLRGGAALTPTTGWKTPMGLGDLNGDGIVNQYNGNIIKIVKPSVTLLSGSNQAGIEGSTTQPIVILHQYNSFGQRITTVDPEGNVSQFAYYSESDPDGDGTASATPADGRTLATSGGGGWLQQIAQDTTSSSTRDNHTNPTPANVTTSYTYDPRGNAITMTDGRGIRTDYAVNQMNQIVQTSRAAAVPSTSSAEPMALTAFAYLSRTFFDYNNNVVLTQAEDRGNTASTGLAGLGTLPSEATNTTPGLSSADPSGVYFVDSLTLYDLLDQPIETRAEVNSSSCLTTRYRYDGNCNRVLVIYPAGNADSTTYDERDLPFQVTKGASSRPSAGLYAGGDPTTFNRAGGSGTVAGTHTLNYDPNKNLVELVNAEDKDGASGNNSSTAGTGDRTLYLYDEIDRRVMSVDPVGSAAGVIYDPNNNVIERRTYGAVGGSSPTSNQVAITDYYVDDHASAFNTTTPQPLLSKIEYSIDEANRTFQSDRALFISSGVSTARTITLTSTAGNGFVTTKFEHDRDSRLTFKINDDGDTYRTLYDGVSRVIKTLDDENNAVEMAYDLDNNVIERLETDASQVSGVSNETFHTTNFYDALNRLQTTVSNIGQAEDYRYDSRNNLVAKADAVGPVNTRSINRRGLGSTASVTVNDFGNVSLTYFDGQSRTLRTESILTSSHQGDGTNIGADIYGVKGTTPTSDTTQGSGDGKISVWYAWDANSQLLALRDDRANVTEYIYDNQNRTLTERKGISSTGTSISISGGDSGEFDSTFSGIAADTIKSSTDITNGYDKDGNLTGRTDEAGNSFTYGYDGAQRRTSLSITPATGFIGTMAQSWQYDGLNRLTQCTDDNGGSSNPTVTAKYLYDSLSRKIEEQQQIGSGTTYAVSSNYDVITSHGVMPPSSTIYPDGREVDNSYDHLDRLLSRKDNGYSNIGTYAYLGKWRVATLTYQNNTRLTHIAGTSDAGFDSLRRVVDHRWESFTTQALGSGNRLVEFGYLDGSSNPAYDRANNKLIEEKLHDSGNSEVYAYDSAYRLNTFNRGTLNTGKTSIATATSTTGQTQNQAWALDGVGNWNQDSFTIVGSTLSTETRTHTDFNEIDAVSGTPYSGGSTGTMGYDHNGNTTDDITKTYQWDALNRLRVVKDKTSGLTLATYTYDCSNRRFRKIVTNSGSLNGTTDFYYDGWRVMEEHDASDNNIRQYTYGNYIDEAWTLDNRAGGITVAQLNDGSGAQRLFYHQNTLYSIFALTDETGVIKEAYQYDAYGRQSVDASAGTDATWFTSDDAWTVGGASAVGNPYGYDGYRYDTETGLHETPGRYYNSGLGRWLSRDPIGYLARDVNLYEYVGDNPVGLEDPFGLWVCCLEWKSWWQRSGYASFDDCVDAQMKSTIWRYKWEKLKSDQPDPMHGITAAGVTTAVAKYGESAQATREASSLIRAALQASKTGEGTQGINQAIGTQVDKIVSAQRVAKIGAVVAIAAETWNMFASFVVRKAMNDCLEQECVKWNPAERYLISKGCVYDTYRYSCPEGTNQSLIKDSNQKKMPGDRMPYQRDQWE